MVPKIPMEAITSKNTPQAMIPPITEMSAMYAAAFASAATVIRMHATTYRTRTGVRTVS